jgi:hypothetical protein
MAKNDKMPISSRTVIRRIGQKLSEGQALKSGRGNGWFVVDRIKGAVIDSDGDLEALGRRLGAVETYERLADD